MPLQDSTPPGTVQKTASTAAIAVLTLTSGPGVTAGDADLLTDRLNYELFRSNTVTILERSQIAAVFKKHDFQQSGTCNDLQCITKIGQLLGVQQVVAGSLSRVGSLWMINLRVVEVATGRITRAVYKDAKGEIGALVAFVPEIVQVITGLKNSMDQPPATALRGGVAITTLPIAATITIDGTRVGTSPFIDSNLTVGSHTITLEHPLFETLQNTIEISDGEIFFLSPTLKARFSTLSIATIPAGATLRLNQTVVGTTPFQSDTLNPGNYEIRLDLPGYKPVAKTITITETHDESLKIELYARGHQVTRIAVFGVLAAVASGAGYYFNEQVKVAYTAEQNALAQYHQGGLTQSQYDEAWQQYGSAYTETSNMIAWRTILYSAAALCGSMFVLSFAF